MYNNSQSAESKVTPLTVPQLRARKRGEKIVSLTAYDSSFAGTIDRAGVDLILIGDSLGMVIQGHDNTLRVTIDSIVYHTRSVCRATQRALVMSDMPFGAYGDEKAAYKNAVKCIAAGAEMVKLEGAGSVVDAIAYLNKRDIPVCAHLGLTPQSVHKLGGYRVQGRDEDRAHQLIQDARAVTNAGADLLVLECVPSVLAKQITAEIAIPTIGIGAGADCDGQILVCYDALGIGAGRRPRFVKNFLQGRDSIEAAFAAFVHEVRAGQFPTAEHSYA